MFTVLIGGAIVWPVLLFGILYRQVLQLERAVRGEQPLLEGEPLGDQAQGPPG
jgi:hypothetical protein